MKEIYLHSAIALITAARHDVRSLYLEDPDDEELVAEVIPPVELQQLLERLRAAHDQLVNLRDFSDDDPDGYDTEQLYTK